MKINTITHFIKDAFISLKRNRTISLASIITVLITFFVLGIFVLGSLQLFFIGLLGEYILNINTRIINRPLVVEEKRINFNTLEKIGS